MEQAPPVATGVATTAVAQVAYAAPLYPPTGGMVTGAPAPAAAASFPASSPLAYHPAHQFHHHQPLQAFWASQMAEVEQVSDFKNHSLPLARIKKIMKTDEDVRMILAEAPVVFARASEIFILELTLWSWIHTEENKRRTLQKSDIAAPVAQTDVFDFLVDIVPRDELKEVDGGLGLGLGVPRANTVVPYYYVPTQHQVAAVGPEVMMMGKPADHYRWQQQPVQQQQEMADSG